MSDCCTKTCQIPGIAGEVSLELPAGLAALRDEVLAAHSGPQHGVPEIPCIDAEAWAEHPDDEPLIVYRGRSCRERLRGMPVEVLAGECVVGVPRFRPWNEEDEKRMEAARERLAERDGAPGWPGGDMGHFHPDYEKLFRVGVRGLLQEVGDRSSADDVTNEQRDFYEGCRLALEGLTAWCCSAAAACEEMAGRDHQDAGLWRERARACRKVSEEPPETFHEAIQLLFLTLTALWFGENHGLTTPGRMDQTLRPLYERDLAAGRVTPEQAMAEIACVYINLNRILWPGSAVSVMVGGRDGQGRDVTNDLTYLCLAAREATHLVYPTVGLAWHEGTPGALTDFSTRMLATGVGDPAFFNDEVIAQGLRANGVSDEDRFNYMNSTCVEIKVCGASHMWVTAPYFNLAQGLLNALDRVASDEVPTPGTWEEFDGLVREEMAMQVRNAARGLDAVWREREERGGVPLASCVISDCLARGRDFDRGGARYNWVENSFVGLANLVDGLTTIRRLVYEHAELSLKDLRDLLQANYEGSEPLRQRILNALPKYGNDDDEADGLARDWAHFLIDTTESNTVGLHHYVAGFFCWIQHAVMGEQTGATPDGRLAGTALADGAGAAQGREKRGPTASVLSTTRWQHERVIGGLVHNAKFSNAVLRTESDRRKLRDVIETFMRRGGFEIQVNVVRAETLRDAQKHPDQHRDLLVRVAGYSDYFVHLNAVMQAEVIERTEHAFS